VNRRMGAVSAAVGLVLLAGSVPATAAPVTTGQRHGCQLPAFGPGSSYHPRIDPADFTSRVDNPYFPLKPGRTLVYAGVKDGKAAINVFAPSARTRVVDGVRTRIVEDRLYLNGVLEERTADYYAQDRCGNVWYFGEDTAQLDRHGHVVDTSGSFHAGVDGAQPGVFMQAQPEAGRRFRQEWYSGQAEDTFHAVDLSTPVSVPYGSFVDALRTAETTALEPGVLDNKYYVQGIGEVVETSIKGPVETLKLVDIIH
jgi:hypothetical protein